MIFNLKKFLRSFRYAFEGLKSAFSEQTFRIFCLVAVVVIFLMFWFEIPLFEKVILILTITLVMTLELINSRIERVLDFLQPNYDPRVKIIKDISAGAVFLASLGALIIGILIFWPYLVK
jgi:diacylglycerol kinase